MDYTAARPRPRPRSCISEEKWTMPEVYRADHVGSLLRPADIHRARAAYREGTLEQHQLRVIEDAAILHALERQQAAGGRHLYRRRVPPLRISERPDRSGGRVRRDGRPGGGAGLAGPGRSAYGAGHSAGGGGQAAPTASVDPVPRHNSCNRTPPGPVKITVPSPSQYPAISYQDGPDRPILPHPLGPAVGHRRDHQSGDCGVA